MPSSLQTERDDYTKPESKKRAREWLDEREYISRRLVETMTSKPSSRSQEEVSSAGQGFIDFLVSLHPIL